MKEHTLSSFDDALRDLIDRVTEMGERVKMMVAKAAPIFLERNLTAADALIRDDLDIDQRKDALIAAAVLVLARHQPVASDLRLVLAVEHIASDLERTADHAKNIAKRATSQYDPAAFDAAIRERMLRLHQAAESLLSDALVAFRDANITLAEEVARQDSVPDEIYDDMFHSVIARIQTSPGQVAGDIQALFVGKSLERIGDHATNIAEEVRFLTRGIYPSATRER